MSISHFLDQSVDITRLDSVSGDKISYQTLATVNCHIQELDAEARQVLGIIEERGWTAYFAVGTDINEQDRITDEDGTVYVVREITKKNYKFAINTHLEATLMEQNA